MGRWRPPAGPSTALVTRAGFERLRAELDDLWRVQRPEVVRALAAAAAEGDRSENAEYSYRKKQLGGIDRRVRYLGKRLEALKVVDTVPSDPTRVFFGATVGLERLDTGEALRYRIVGPDETDARGGHISIDSPLARALLGRRVGDEVEARLPGGAAGFHIVAISYDQGAGAGGPVGSR
jgi:transcription elongation factor GreB